MAKISLQDLSSVLVERRHIGKKEASQFVNEMFYLIQKNLNEDKIVKVKGLGTFKIIDVEDRESVDVNTGDRVLIEGHGKITFTPDALMKELVNKPFSQFETVVLKDGVDFDEEQEPMPEPESEPESEVEVSPKPAQEPLVESDGSYENPSAAPLVEFVTDTTDEEASDDVKASDEPEVEAPVVESVEKTPIEEAPVEEQPTEERPAEDPLTEEAPDEKSDEEVEAEEESSGEESADEAISEDVYVEENPHPWKWILIALAAAVIGFIAGYLVGKNVEAKEWTPEETYQKTEQPAVDSLKPVKAAEPAVKPEQSAKDSITSAAESPKPETETAKPAAPAQEAVKPAETAKAEEPVVLDKYEQMDSRVRTGAYRILGTDHIEKAKAGDNLTRICNRTIGKGMECYLEVYNGLKPDAELKAGQEIKIPKLELKKKKQKK